MGELESSMRGNAPRIPIRSGVTCNKMPPVVAASVNQYPGVLAERWSSAPLDRYHHRRPLNRYLNNKHDYQFWE